MPVDVLVGDRESFFLPFHAHEEHVLLKVHVLVEVDDVPVVF